MQKSHFRDFILFVSWFFSLFWNFSSLQAVSLCRAQELTCYRGESQAPTEHWPQRPISHWRAGPVTGARSQDLTRAPHRTSLFVSVRQNLSPAQDVAEGDKQQQLESADSEIRLRLPRGDNKSHVHVGKIFNTPAWLRQTITPGSLWGIIVADPGRKQFCLHVFNEFLTNWKSINHQR